MQAKKYQIFVSSTYTDLIEERREIIETIIDLGHIPAGMEGFPAIDIEQFRYIQKVIDQCDYYVLIVGGRYGSLAADGSSFTEKEYRYAVESGKIVIAFVLDSEAAARLPVAKIETDPNIVARLERFKADVMNGRLVRQWSDGNSLSKSVIKSLFAAFEEFPGEGWVRASVQASEDVLAQINQLRIKNEELGLEVDRLTKQLAPQFENIAPLDSNYLVRYSYWDSRESHRETTSVSLSWREIFVGVAPHLTLPKSPTMLKEFLERYLRAANLVYGRDPSINQVSADQIRIQLAGYRLIQEIRGENTKGGLGEWIQVTDLGERVMREAMIVRLEADLGPDGAA